MENYIYVDKNDIIMESPIGPNKIKILYADATATGLPSPIIENYVLTKVLPYYCNTHSNAYCSNYMNYLMNDTKKYLRKKYNLDENKVILFSGNGATGAINHLVYLIDYSKYRRVNVVISISEHYSNYLPWMKIRKENRNVTVWYIPLNDFGQIDLNLLESFLKKSLIPEDLTIISMTACSNVTGIKTNLEKLQSIVSKYNLYKNIKTFIDLACLAPYDVFDGNAFTGFFFSGHKFVGGNGTPGVLIVDKSLVQKDIPFMVGGGTVNLATGKMIEYKENIEERESAGTPNIIGIIKLKKVLELNDNYMNIIKRNEDILTKYIHNRLMEMKKVYNKLEVIFLNKSIENRLPIICINISGMHYNEIVKILSDKFGIQTRGGNSCAGLLGNYINIIGWCRITFSWYMSMDEVNYILNAILHILKNI